MRYSVIEPSLTPSETRLLQDVKDLLKIALTVKVSSLKSTADAERFLRGETVRIFRRFGYKVSKSIFDKIMYYLVRDYIGYGTIDPLMRDPQIEDISCDGPKGPVYVWHREYASIPSNITYLDSDALDKFVLRMAYRSGKHVSVAQPLVDASLPDGSRLQMTYGTEVTKKGSTFTIRKFKEDPLTVIDLIKYNTLSADIAALMWFVLENKASILIAGSTASGKTTTINCLSMFISPDAKLVTIEDTPEINLAHTNWIQSVSRTGVAGVGDITLFDLVKAALRQRPDFIIVGEVRGGEASVMFQALATGHAGLSSIHADSVASTLRRLTSEPMNIPRQLIPAVNYILLQSRVEVGGKSARRILSVSEILGVDPRTNEFMVNETYKHDMKTDTYRYSGRSYVLEDLAARHGYTPAYVAQELERRRVVLEWMANKNIRKYRQVTDVIRQYYQDRESLLGKVRMEAT
jgi:flagellar protein FlaI